MLLQKVKVTKAKGDGSEVELTRLKENQYFGERALIKNEPRGASVTCGRRGGGRGGQSSERK